MELVTIDAFRKHTPDKFSLTYMQVFIHEQLLVLLSAVLFELVKMIDK